MKEFFLALHIVMAAVTIALGREGGALPILCGFALLHSALRTAMLSNLADAAQADYRELVKDLFLARDRDPYMTVHRYLVAKEFKYDQANEKKPISGPPAGGH